MRDLKGGGAWLGAARSFMQREFVNGYSVTWGTSDVMQPPATEIQLERMALEVAQAQQEDDKQGLVQLQQFVAEILAKGKVEAWDLVRAKNLGVELPNEVEVGTIVYGLHTVTIPKGFRVLGGREWVTAEDQWYLAEGLAHGRFCKASQEHVENNNRARDILGTVFIRREDA